MEDVTLLSVLFGLAGTFIILFSQIYSYRNRINDKDRYHLISQMIGYLFLFDSFLYLIYPNILSFVFSEKTEFVINSFWPYYVLVLSGLFISFVLVKEKDFGWGSHASIWPENKLQLIVLYLPFLIAILALIFNSDFLLFFNLVLWFYLMGGLIRK